MLIIKYLAYQEIGPIWTQLLELPDMYLKIMEITISKSAEIKMENFPSMLNLKYKRANGNSKRKK